MATIKIVYRRTLQVKEEGKVYFCVKHESKKRQINTGVCLSEPEWRILSGNNDGSLSTKIRTAAAKLNEGKAKLWRIIDDLENRRMPFSADDVADIFVNSCGCEAEGSYSLTREFIGGRGNKNDFSVERDKFFFIFGRKLMQEYERIGRRSAAEHVATALRSFNRFREGVDLAIGNMDERIMKSYECWLSAGGLCPNTISYYMRKLRAIYNIAVERLGIVPRNPFRHVYTGVAKTVKRAIPIDMIKKLRDLDLSGSPDFALARDMFLFSFYTRGMSIVDMAYLKTENLSDGFLSYRRRKTKQLLVIKWEKEMEEIMCRYHIEGSDYLLPLIKSPGINEVREYRTSAHYINSHLKILGRELGMSEPLTMYVARYSWASIAYENNVPLAVISQGMGHESEKTTQIYLASIDRSLLDNANNAIIGLLNA